MADFEVSPDDMHSAADTMNSISEDFESELARLRKVVRSIIGSSWQGTAAQSHDSAWDEFFEGAGDIVAGLSNDAVALHRAAAEYQARDQSTSQALWRLQSSAGPSSLDLP
ncbi:WXG100 family type VII secretion target [Nocardia macrotermitis]|uniref:WXG100 family type VII secretion target n=1 Tax=Nocardia macrotermitis TaxID=2585198 RepID=UPI001297B92E|nr:WXG100 family type VII secretion target [Nocardia macrotermitis]